MKTVIKKTSRLFINIFFNGYLAQLTLIAAIMVAAQGVILNSDCNYIELLHFAVWCAWLVSLAVIRIVYRDNLF